MSHPRDRRPTKEYFERTVSHENKVSVLFVFNGREYRAAVQFDPREYQNLASFNTSDDPLLAMAFGEIRSGTYAEQKRKHARESEVRFLFEALAENIADQLSGSDKVNGYDKR